MAKHKRKYVRAPQKVVEEFSITLDFGNQRFHSSGATVIEALKMLAKPQKILTKGVLTVSRGARKIERLYMPVQLRRLFYPISQPVQAKMLQAAFE